MRKKRNILAALLATAIAAVLFVGWLHTDSKTVEKSGFAMGTVVTARLYGGSEDDAAAALAAVTALENEISRNIDTSAVSVLNRTGRAESEVLADAVTACRTVSAASDGAFDITVGALTALWDFDDGGVLPDAGEIESALPYIDYNRLTVDGDTITADAGTQIDLGAVGKGAACDAVRDVLAARGVRGGIVSVGGSVLAFGRRNAAGDKWRIAVRHPRDADSYLGVITLAEGCVSTSGDYEKYFEKDGVRYHHLLDPATGYPAKRDLISVTVVCESGLRSDALSTACFVLGSARGAALVEAFGAGAVFVRTDGTVTTVGDVVFSQ